MISRRKFLAAAAMGGPMATGAGVLLSGRESPCFFPFTGQTETSAAARLEDIIRRAPKARYWISTVTAGTNCQGCHESGIVLEASPHTDQPAIVKCLLCAQECSIAEGERGRCRARMNVDGELRSLVYGRPVAVHIDPIEKKPFYHFLPGSAAFSLATTGCPLRCKFCQNWDISQAKPEDHETRFIPPDAIADSAASRRSPVIAYTYNEPTVFAEYLLDIARLGKKRRLRSVMISCGFMNTEPLDEMCDVLEAIKVDLKGFDEDFYRNVCSAELQPVLRNLKHIARRGRHLEIVNLVVPTLNDSEKMLRELAKWVVGELGPDVPIHFSRFHPDFQLLNLPPTPVATLELAREIALSHGIHYPFVGNVPGHPGNHTYCPACGKIVINRNGYFIAEMNLEKGKCKFCGESIAGVWT